MKDKPAGERWSSRKFWSAMVWQLAFTILTTAGKLPTEAYVTLTYLTLGGYFASNLASKYIERAES